MAIYHNHIVVIGRMHGDDEDHSRVYEHTTVEIARQQFINDVCQDNKVSATEIASGEEWTNVYIRHVIMSPAPMIVESERV